MSRPYGYAVDILFIRARPARTAVAWRGPAPAAPPPLGTKRTSELCTSHYLYHLLRDERPDRDVNCEKSDRTIENLGGAVNMELRVRVSHYSRYHFYSTLNSHSTSGAGLQNARTHERWLYA